MGTQSIRTNLQNLAAQERAGMWPDEAGLRSAVINMWKGRDYPPPPEPETGPGTHDHSNPTSNPLTWGTGTATAYTQTTDVGTISQQAPLTETITPIHEPAPTTMDQLEPTLLTDPLEEPTNPTPGDVGDSKACPDRRRHGPLKAKGRACPTCGYTG